jgi:hypothetical protein
MLKAKKQAEKEAKAALERKEEEERQQRREQKLKDIEEARLLKIEQDKLKAEALAEKAAREEKILAGTPSKQLEQVPTPERQVLKLERELLPHLLTPGKRRAARNDIYRHGLRFEKMQPWIDSVYTAALTLAVSCRSVTGNEFPALALLKVSEFSKPDIKDFDCRKDTVEDDSDVDLWDKPEDACSENGFLGGYNAVAKEGEVHPKDDPPNCVCS